MRRVRQVTDFEPIVAGFLVSHADRLADELPRGIWICEEDGVPIVALLAYTNAESIRVSIVRRSNDDACWLAIYRLVTAFEDWISALNIQHYGMSVHSSDQRFCRILERRGAISVHEKDGWIEYLHTIERFRSPLTDGIRHWDARDWKHLRPLIRDLLSTLAQDGGDLLPTRKTVEALIQLGVRSAARGDPCLVAQEDGAIVGFIEWVGNFGPEPFDIRPGLCCGIGTYVIPGQRRTGWGKRLSETALEIARQRGYQVVKDAALTPYSLQFAQSYGATPCGVLLRTKIKG